MEDKRVEERKLTADGLFLYHDRWLWSIAVFFMSDVRLNSLGDAIKTARAAFRDERPDSPRVQLCICSDASQATTKGDWDIWGYAVRFVFWG